MSVDYEQLGVFYLGKEYDFDRKACTDSLLLYESRDLLTHAVCVGMTGSGKTGLCIDMLEEAAIDNIPVIAVDVKGDLANLMLNFPELAPESFLPYIDEDEARRAQLSKEALAEREAAKWKDGLSDWQQDGERIRRLRESAQFAIYTPCANIGQPLSILKSFNCPSKQVLEERDLLKEQISSTATSILALLGISADPLKSKEHILLASILEFCWKQGQNLDLHGLIEKIQNPPMSQVGALSLESFYPQKERFEFAVLVNNLLASPGFEAWLEGEALDIDRLLYSEKGKNKLSIISIAHLPDAERMFFVSLLLTQLLSWMRIQSGTSSLRALFYMDEILGYFPPVANPPSKIPLITLLKQARAFGLGLVLATQNPVDLDYKALGNTGTWFVGRLQTERDKLRLLDGLESAASDSGQSFNRKEMDKLISGLSKQVFLMNNVHQSRPVIFKSRWALSYLKGPLSRMQLRALKENCYLESGSEPGSDEDQLVGASSSAGAGAAMLAGASSASGSGADESQASVAGKESSSGVASSGVRIRRKRLLDPAIKEKFASIGRELPEGAELTYKPMIYASCQLRFLDSKSKIDNVVSINLLTLIKSGEIPPNWGRAFNVNFNADALKDEFDERIEFSELPQEATIAACYKDWTKDLIDWLTLNKKLELFCCPHTALCSNPGEPERDFRIRLMQTAREKRDRVLDELSARYQPKLAALEEKLALAHQKLSKEQSEARMLQLESTVNVGASIFEALVGRKVVSKTNIKRATSAANKMARVSRKNMDVDEAQQSVDKLEGKLEQLQSEFASEMAGLKASLDPETQKLERLSIGLKKSNINLKLFCLCWAPCIRQPDGKIKAAW